MLNLAHLGDGMSLRAPSRLREVGTAFAVLAIYLLVLLAPLHQAAGLQRDLTALGFTNLDSRSVCGQLSRSDDGTVTPVKCAASGIGKNELAAIEPAAIAVGIVRIAALVGYVETPQISSGIFDRATGQPRAPPVPV